MSCNSECFTNNCVCDTLLAIVEAQDKVDGPTGCTFSCDNAINELVGGVANGGFNTIPIILTCKNTCLPFVGVGGLIDPNPTPPVSGRVFEFPVSPIFRVNDVDPETCCATLELLSTEDPIVVSPSFNPDPFEILNDLTGEVLEDTGSCITVDLNCFCAVTCLSPITV
ncbi:CotY/CotZ family spore coat protein [Mesobacillus zeae]|uniref:Spore coat protein n=1 Tax=Mesobacillus zeae TaxID=1917180 RepID=A0A398AZD6_9BACI|nr:CotY/CotZ family spore coat protein [Mesobacillus zeae]RID82038.1 spore coat protein [Mesobacillus zeae]